MTWSDLATSYYVSADTTSVISCYRLDRSIDWLWEPADRRLTIIHDVLPIPAIVAPAIHLRRSKPFLGHKFKLGG